MIVLGIESSCDDTAAAVVENGRIVLSSVVSSQDTIHAKYGGVVPELASRSHIEAIVPVVDEALVRAGVTLGDIDAIAVTQGPGLVGCLLIGLSFPFADLIVSGGHTTLLYFEDYTKYRILGQTLDDSAGEAFDKVAKLLGLGYPGGAVIDRLAKEGDARAIAFPRPLLGKGNLDFSFSGLKTAVLTHVRGLKEPPDEGRLKNIAASFHEAVVDSLVTKGLWAARETGVKNLVVAGGVASNSRFRAALAEAAETEGLKLFIPPPKYCTDNAAMVAALGTRQLERGEVAGPDLNALPTWEGIEVRP